MILELDIQRACTNPLPVSDEQLSAWVECALRPHREKAELTLRLVETDEITNLNHTYRKKNKATNVLAFPANLPDDIVQEYPLLGDVIVCPLILQEEAEHLHTPLVAHWAHIIIHGVLHLLGYDHMNTTDERIMQALEIKALEHFGFDNPYAD